MLAGLADGAGREDGGRDAVLLECDEVVANGRSTAGRGGLKTVEPALRFGDGCRLRWQERLILGKEHSNVE